MMKPIIASATLGFLAVSTAALATQDGASSAQSASTDGPSTTEIVCRRMPPPAGSRIGARRICKTEMEWSILDRENRTAMEQAFNRGKMQDNEQ